MSSFLKALHQKTKEDNLESLDSDPRGLPLNSISDSVNSALQSTSRFGQDVAGTVDSIKGTSFGGIGNSLKGKLTSQVNAAEDQAKAAALSGLKFGSSSISKGLSLDKIKETLPAANTARILENNLKDLSKGGMDLLKNSLEDSLKDSLDRIGEETNLPKITDQMKQIGLPGIKDPKSFLQDQVDNIKNEKDKIEDKLLSSKFTLGNPLTAVNNSVNQLNNNVNAAASKGISDIGSSIKGSLFSGLKEKDLLNKIDLSPNSIEGTIKQGALQGVSMLSGQLSKIQQAAEGDEENQQRNFKINNIGQLQIPFDDQMKPVAERMPEEDVPRRSSSGNPFLLGGQQVPQVNLSLEKNAINNISGISKMKASQLQKELPKMDGLGSQLSEIQGGQLQKQMINQIESQLQPRGFQSQLNQQLHQQYLPPNQLQLSSYSAQQQQQAVNGYLQQNMNNNNFNMPGQQQLQFNTSRLNQALKAESSNSKNAPPEIQPLVLPQVQQLISDNLLNMLPWILLCIIGLWTIIFMIAQIAYFSNFSFFKTNSQEDVSTWYSTNTDLQQAALDINSGLSQNTITLLDFLIYFVITKAVYAIWMSEDYFGSGVCKDFFVMLFLLKDIAIIVLSLSAGFYDNSASGWSNFGFYWLSSIGKLSIIISIQKIIFFRLYYFRQFSQQKTGCTGALRDWGVSLHNWASLKQEQFPELVIIIIFTGFLYLPLIIHLIVGLIQFTFIVIIWVSIVFLLQQVLSFVFEICRPRQQEQTFTERLMENQKQGISEQLTKYWVFFLPLIVLAPSISSASFSDSFEQSMKIYLSGSQLILNYFAIPSGNASYSSTISFICNLLSLF